jgi:hypothetical protein
MTGVEQEVVGQKRYLLFEPTFERASGQWCLVGKDSRGGDFGVGASSSLEVATKRLREWVVEAVWSAAADGIDILDDLQTREVTSQDALVFKPGELPEVGAAERQRRLGV